MVQVSQLLKSWCYRIVGWVGRHWYETQKWTILTTGEGGDTKSISLSSLHLQEKMELKNSYGAVIIITIMSFLLDVVIMAG